MTITEARPATEAEIKQEFTQRSGRIERVLWVVGGEELVLSAESLAEGLVKSGIVHPDKSPESTQKALQKALQDFEEYYGEMPLPDEISDHLALNGWDLPKS